MTRFLSSNLDLILVVVCLVLVLLPRKWDPAIRLKEFNEAWAKRLRERE